MSRRISAPTSIAHVAQTSGEARPDDVAERLAQDIRDGETVPAVRSKLAAELADADAGFARRLALCEVWCKEGRQ